MVVGTGLVGYACPGAAADRGVGRVSVRVWAERATMLAAYAWIVERMVVGLLAQGGVGPLV